MIKKFSMPPLVHFGYACGGRGSFDSLSINKNNLTLVKPGKPQTTQITIRINVIN